VPTNHTIHRTLSNCPYEIMKYYGKSENKVPYFIATQLFHILRCLFIHLKFRHWSLDGSTFAAQVK